MAIFDEVKVALRRNNTTAFDTDIQGLIDAALLDLSIAGVTVNNAAPSWSNYDPLVLQAIKTYCKANFGETDEYINLRDSYETQKAQLMVASGYTDYDVYGITSVLDDLTESEGE